MISLFDLERVWVLLLLFTRTSAFVFAAPFLGDRPVPTRVRILFSLILALVLVPIVPAPPRLPEDLVALTVALFADAVTGLAMGFVARLFIAAFEIAGEIISVQMGFGIAALLDPIQSHRSTLISRWLWIVGLTLFLVFDGHHILLRTLAASVELVPPGEGLFTPHVMEGLVRLGAYALALGVRIAAPVIGVLLLTMMGMGILARTVPQMNIFIVGFPIKIAVGLLSLMLTLPYVAELARREVGALAGRLMSLVAGT